MNIFIAEITGQRGVLTPEESWHCTKVLRRQSGDTVHLIDGKGNFYDAILDVVTDSQCTVRITKGPVAQDDAPYYLHLAIAPTKQIDRIEWMIEKAVEIGVHELSFVTCLHSERSSLKSERVLKIAESAVKQSLQARIPKINDLISFKEFLKHPPKSDQKFIAHCYELPKKEIRTLSFRSLNTLVVVGPEGDFAKEELDHAIEKGFDPISLGKTRLRSETAGLYVCQAASLLTAN